jgi:probable F420-dependent oxidoreductase
MKFGLQLPTFGRTASPEIIMESARLAEELGFDSIWTNDHVIVPHRLGIPYSSIFECLTTLAVTIPITSRVKLGTSIIVLPQRNPIVVAKQIAAIDVLSGGRVIMGIGAGYVREEFAYLGAAFDQRGERIEEYQEAMRTLWRDGGGSFEGRWVKFKDALFAPRPEQGDRVPIWLGGNQPRTIRRAARWADAWHPGALTADELAEGAAALRREADGRSVAVTLKLRAGFPGVGGASFQRSPEDFSSAHDLRGGPSEMRMELQAYEQAGLEYLVVFFYHSNREELRDSLVTFAEEVMPHFAD